jgi:hypothetical protein
MDCERQGKTRIRTKSPRRRNSLIIDSGNRVSSKRGSRNFINTETLPRRLAIGMTCSYSKRLASATADVARQTHFRCSKSKLLWQRNGQLNSYEPAEEYRVHRISHHPGDW